MRVPRIMGNGSCFNSVEMKLTGFTDEASADIDAQINVTKELGWDYLSLRTVGNKNIHDISEEEFESVCEKLTEANVKVAEFGTLIGSWSKSIHSKWEVTEQEVERCIDRMKKLDVRLARIMSYAQLPWGEDQYEQERYKRLRSIVERFREEGIEAVHENCMNYGGFSAEHTLRLVEEVPGLKLVFDTGNPVFQKDRSKTSPYPWQDALEFYTKIKQHITHIHVKDVVILKDEEPVYVYPGEGDAYVKEIISDLSLGGYNGFLAIEPHMGKVFHEDFKSLDASREYEVYLKYGKKFQELVKKIGSN